MPPDSDWPGSPPFEQPSHSSHSHLAGSSAQRHPLPYHSRTAAPAQSSAHSSPHIPSTPSDDTTAPPPEASRLLRSPSSTTLANGHDRTLPPLRSITRGQPLHRNDMADLVGSSTPPPPPWSAMTSLPLHNSHQDTGPSPAPAHSTVDSPATMDLDTRSNSVASAASPDARSENRAASVNLDDPDVRLAAEALGDLRTESVSSPPGAMSPPAAAHLHSSRTAHEAEPLFALLTTSHPLLATTIEGATSAYGGAKNFSPRFKSSAEYVEGYLTPIANTVGSVGRVTGVEGGVRWFLGASRAKGSDAEATAGSKKRRKIDSSASGPDAKKRAEAERILALSATTPDLASLHDSYPSTPKSSSRLSIASTAETLPAYDDLRSPAYTETMDTETRGPSTDPRANAPWKSRLIMSTSGLSVAMSDESLRSLKYCLRWLRWANEHMGGVIGNLKTTLEQYERPDHEGMAQLAIDEAGQDPTAASSGGEGSTREPSRAELASQINRLKGDVLKTLQDAITMVSRYAGGALPENARELVRRHLTSLPQRFRLATMSDADGQNANQDSDLAVRDGAHKVLVLAKEGLDMVSQITGIVDGTIVSAEEWCERMGKKTMTDAKEPEDSDSVLPPNEANNNGDVKMG